MASTKMAKTNPVTFLKQVRSEIAKVTWPSRRETLLSTIMVLVFVAIMMVFLGLANQLFGWLVGLVLGL